MSTAFSSPRLVSSQADSRLLSRVAQLTQLAPEPPRSFTVDNRNLFTWDPPATLNFTHYLLRINSDADNAYKYALPAQQTCLQLFKGTTFYLSTYNDSNGLESYRVRLAYNAETAVFGGGSGAASYVDTHTVTGSSYSVTTARTATSGDQLTVIIYMNSTASSITITPSVDFLYWPSSLNTDQTTYSVLTFTGDGSKWVCTGWRTGLS